MYFILNWIGFLWFSNHGFSRLFKDILSWQDSKNKDFYFNNSFRLVFLWNGWGRWSMHHRRCFTIGIITLPILLNRYRISRKTSKSKSIFDLEMMGPKFSDVPVRQSLIWCKPTLALNFLKMVWYHRVGWNWNDCTWCNVKGNH